MTEDAPRKAGRPPAREPSTPVSLRLSAREFDHLCQLAKQRDQSLSACLRRLIGPKLKP
jgi:hypothetical protein